MYQYEKDAVLQPKELITDVLLLCAGLAKYNYQ
jgi:hypothetical protein